MYKRQAVIRNQLSSQNGGTRVVAVTDLKITGRQAQFGRGIMEDVATTMMAQFAKRLESEIQAGTTAPSAGPEKNTSPRAEAPGASAPAPEPDAEPEALDLGNVLTQTPLVRYGAIAGVALVVVALVALIRGRRRQLSVTLNLRR